VIRGGEYQTVSPIQGQSEKSLPERKSLRNPFPLPPYIDERARSLEVLSACIDGDAESAPTMNSSLTTSMQRTRPGVLTMDAARPSDKVAADTVVERNGLK